VEEVDATMELEVAAGLVTVFMLAVTVLSGRSYMRNRSRKALLVTVAFAVFFVKGAILSYGLMQEDVAWEDLFLLALLMDAVVAILLFVAVIARKGGE
jgi:uncharacterized protein involved in response to NO